MKNKRSILALTIIISFLINFSISGLNSEVFAEEGYGIVKVNYLDQSGFPLTYIDENNNETVFSPIILKGRIGDIYATQGLYPKYDEIITDTDYAISKIEGETIGKFKSEEIEVNYYYWKMSEDNYINVKHISTINGKKYEIARPTIYWNSSGKPYKILPEVLPDFTPLDNQEIEGKYTDKTQTLEIEYNYTPQYTDNENSSVILLLKSNGPDMLYSGGTKKTIITKGKAGETGKIIYDKYVYGGEIKSIGKVGEWENLMSEETDTKRVLSGTFKDNVEVLEIEYEFASKMGSPELIFKDKYGKNIIFEDVGFASNWKTDPWGSTVGTYYEVSPKLYSNDNYDYKDSKNMIYKFYDIDENSNLPYGIREYNIDIPEKTKAMEPIIFLYDRVFTVTYKDRYDTTGTPPIDSNNPYDRDNEAIVLGKGELEFKDNAGQFAGWSLKEYETEKTNLYKENNTIKFDEALIARLDATDDLNSPEGITLYPQWTHTVTYQGDTDTTGDAPTDNREYLTKSNVEILDKGNLKKEGYKFVGWKDQDGSSYNAGENMVITKNTILTAQWQKVDECTLRYNGNGYTDGEVPESKTYPSGREVTVAEPGTMVKKNNTFTHWNTKADNSGDTYYPGDKITVGPKTKSSNLELENTNEDITKVEVEDTENKLDEQVENIEDTEVDIETNQATKEDLILENTNGNNTDVVSEELTTNSEENTVTVDSELEDVDAIENKDETPCSITLYAQWKEDDKYKVEYDGNNADTGNPPVDNKDYYSGEEVTVRGSNTLRKEGYRFLGWSTDKDATTPMYRQDDVFNITGNTKLYAVWQKIIVTVPTEPDYQEPSEPVDPDPVPELNKKDHYAYMVGEKDKNFRPNDNITRAEAVTIFFRMLTENSRNQYWSTVNNFKDVKETAWYNNAVSTMVNAKVIEADANGNFRPNEAMTRGEFAVLLSKFFNETGTKTHSFTDISGHFAEEEIARVAAKGWIEGYLDKTFRPDEPITRAETVKLVNRILERTPDIKNLLPNMIEFKDNQDTNKWYYVEIQEAANSHEYTRKYSKSTETWTKLLPVRDWVALEKEWSKANSSTNPGNVK